MKQRPRRLDFDLRQLELRASLGTFALPRTTDIRY